MKEHYLELFAYEDWAMKKIIPLLEESQETEARKIFSHILFARQIWFNRVSRQNKSTDFTEKTLEEYVGLFQKNQREWMDFLDSVEDFETIVSYQNTEGTEFSSQLKHILTHLINHSTYHRGQITNSLKGKVKLISTDFIFFLREK